MPMSNDTYEINPMFMKPKVSEQNFLKGMNDRQKKAINANDGPYLVIAGAGTGKTSVLTNRIARLIASGIPSEQILALTFTNKAAKEMKGRIAIKVNDENLNIMACTYHSFATIMLRRYGNRIGLDRNFTIMDGTDAAEAINLLKERLGYGKIKEFPRGNHLVNIYSSNINNEIPISEVVEDDYPDYIDFLNDIIKIQKEYQNYKREKSILDYDDILTLFYKLICDNDDICKFLSDTYRYILVDEYQDSNLIQFKILKKLRSYDNKNIMVVGDDFQSIYRFRGAIFENIINFPNEFENCEVIVLNENYRSNQHILNLANGLIEQAEQKYLKDLHANAKDGIKPLLVKTETQDMEARFVLSKMDELHRSMGIPYKDMAAIIRGSRDSLMLEKLLLQYKFPYEKFGGIKFMEKKHIKDILAFVKVSINPKDEISWFRIFKLYPNIGSVYSKRITDEIIVKGMDELKDEKYASKSYGTYLPEIYQTISKISEMSLKEELDFLIEYRMELIDKIIGLSKKNEATKQELRKDNDEDYKESKLLLDFAEGYSSAKEFITDLTLETPNKDNDDDYDYFNVTTVHSAKGLEYKVVFILSCVDGTFPWDFKPKVETPRTLKKYKDSIEEERRVLYVAVTRAKAYLYLMYPQNVFKGGYNSQPNISRFLTQNKLKEKYLDEIYVR